MIGIIRTLHRASLLAVVLGVVAASAATAATTPPDRADGLYGAHPQVHGSAVIVPDRLDHIGTTVATAVTQAPDRADGLGSARLPTSPTPTVIVRTDRAPSGFDWLAASAGALAALGIAALVAAGFGMRSRRQMALPS